MASLAGLTTTLGALVIFAMPRGPPPRAMAFVLSLAAGVMVTITSELFWGKRHGLLMWLLFLAGAVGTWILTKLATALERHSKLDEGQAEDEQLGEASKLPRMWRLAVVLFVSLTLHNFPEGMAVAVSAYKSYHLGLTICIGIACHNIPEGITIAVTTYDATKSKATAIMMTFLSGIAEPLGAISAVLFLRPWLTEEVIDSLVSVVAGVMLYISMAELLPEAVATKCPLWVAVGFLAGIAVIVATSLIIEQSIGG